jgi:periplasmic protein CpxP/Spy
VIVPRRLLTAMVPIFFATTLCQAIALQGPEPGRPGDADRPFGPPPPLHGNHGPIGRTMHMGPPGKWWSNPEIAQEIGLTADQQKRMDEIFNRDRLKLIDLSAALQKQEFLLEPLVSADQPDEARVLAQIDRVAQARAELEKGNARMLLSIRRVLTTDQFKKLQSLRPPRAGLQGPR